VEIFHQIQNLQEESLKIFFGEFKNLPHQLLRKRIVTDRCFV